VRLRSSVYGVTAVRPSALSLFVGKQTETIASAVDNKIRSFQLHDESIVDFDPSGSVGSCSFFSVFKVLRQICFRLWWIPWDRGKKRFLLFDSHTDSPLQKLSRGKMNRFKISSLCFNILHRESTNNAEFNRVHRSLIQLSNFGMNAKENSISCFFGKARLASVVFHSEAHLASVVLAFFIAEERYGEVHLLHVLQKLIASFRKNEEESALCF
jgi:hypothetical protein